MLAIVILILSCFTLCSFLIFIPYFFGPKNKASHVKDEAYECGLVVPKKTSSHISVKFFLTAILFIIFDIEIMFLYPFALSFRDFLQSDYGLQVLIAMGGFLLLFIFGLWWEIKTKALEWK